MLPFKRCECLFPFSFALIFSCLQKLFFRLARKIMLRAEKHTCASVSAASVYVCACVHEFSVSPSVRPLSARALYISFSSLSATAAAICFFFTFARQCLIFFVPFRSSTLMRSLLLLAHLYRRIFLIRESEITSKHFLC